MSRRRVRLNVPRLVARPPSPLKSETCYKRPHSTRPHSCVDLFLSTASKHRSITASLTTSYLAARASINTPSTASSSNIHKGFDAYRSCRTYTAWSSKAGSTVGTEALHNRSHGICGWSLVRDEYGRVRLLHRRSQLDSRRCFVLSSEQLPSTAIPTPWLEPAWPLPIRRAVSATGSSIDTAAGLSSPA